MHGLSRRLPRLVLLALSMVSQALSPIPYPLSPIPYLISLCIPFSDRPNP